MRLEPEERRNYVHQQLDEYGRIYMSCLELFVYKLWSRQRLLLKNNKIYEEKLMTISEVIGTLTSPDQIVDANKNECDKLESVIQKIHRIVFIPPNKETDLHMVNELLVKEAEDNLGDLIGPDLDSSGSHLLSPLGLSPIDRGRHHSVIKTQSSTTSSSSTAREATTSRESSSSSIRVNGTRGNRGSTGSSSSTGHGSTGNSTNNNNNNGSRRDSDLKSNNGNGHVTVISSPLHSREVTPRRLTASSTTASGASDCGSSANQSINQGNTNGKGANGGSIIGDKESDSGYSNRRSMSTGKRSNGSNGGNVSKKTRNNRTKDDKEIVKCCAQKGCEYIERDNANNMRKHYRNWHDDIDYPPAPYVKREMTTEMVNQYLHNWMIQRKKKQQPRSRTESRPSSDSWQGIPLEGMLVYHDESGNQDDDYEINEHLIASFIKAEKQADNSK